MNSLYGNFRTRTFIQIFDTVDTFTNFLSDNGIPLVITNDHAKVLYYLLYAKFGNSHIASSDENRFKYAVAQNIYSYGGQWEKRLEIQETLKSFSIDDILSGQQFITNHALNPGETQQGGTGTDTILTYINEQNVSKTKRSKTTAIIEFYQAIQSPTENFLNHFRDLFLKIVEPERPLWYITEEGEQDNE